MLIAEADSSSAHRHSHTYAYAHVYRDKIRTRTHSSKSIVSGYSVEAHWLMKRQMEWMEGWKDVEIDRSPVCFLPFSPPLSAAHNPG